MLLHGDNTEAPGRRSIVQLTWRVTLVRRLVTANIPLQSDRQFWDHASES